MQLSASRSAALALFAVAAFGESGVLAARSTSTRARNKRQLTERGLRKAREFGHGEAPLAVGLDKRADGGQFFVLFLSVCWLCAVPGSRED